MKILLSSDWHCDAMTAGHERFEEVENHVHGIIQRAQKGDLDLICFLGDAFDPGSFQESRWSQAVMQWAVDLAECATYGALFLTDNHDVLDISTAEGLPISTLGGIAALESMAMRASHSIMTPTLADLPGFYRFRNPKSPPHDESYVCVLVLPYVSRVLETSDLYAVRLENAFNEARKRPQDQPLIVLGHLSFEGMHPGSESDMMRGRDVPFPIAEVAALKPAFVANGHYHRREVIRRGELTIQIVGAPLQFTFGEEPIERGFLIVEV